MSDVPPGDDVLGEVLELVTGLATTVEELSNKVDLLEAPERPWPQPSDSLTEWVNDWLIPTFNLTTALEDWEKTQGPVKVGCRGV